MDECLDNNDLKSISSTVREAMHELYSDDDNHDYTKDEHKRKKQHSKADSGKGSFTSP